MGEKLTAQQRLGLKQVIGAIAEDLGISVSEVEAMTTEEIQPHIQRLLARAEASLRKNAREGIVFRRIAELMPEGELTLEQPA